MFYSNGGRINFSTTIFPLVVQISWILAS